MKCPKCVEEGEPSLLYSGASSSTTMAGMARFWDEDGNEHNHDPNVVTQHFSCSRNHQFVQRWNNPCPTCDKGKDVVKEILFL